MKKIALLFGNTNGLPGVQKDLINFRDFLMSDIGGAWRYSTGKTDETEIILKENVSKDWLKDILMQLKENPLDYLIIYFSGHGGAKRNQDYIVLNADGDKYFVSDLENIAIRQLNIYDCCRSRDKEDAIAKSMNNYSLLIESEIDLISYRRIYENRIMQAKPQQMTLYSCSENECSI